MSWPLRDGRPPAGTTRVAVSLETFEGDRLVVRSHSFDVPVSALPRRLTLTAAGLALVDLPFYTEGGCEDDCEHEDGNSGEGPDTPNPVSVSGPSPVLAGD